MAETTATQTVQEPQTTEERGQGVVKGILNFLKEWIEHICLGKPFYYKALEKIEQNLDELSTQNAFTTEILDDLYSVVSEMHGRMNNLTPETLPQAIDDINTKIEAIKTKVDVFKSIDSVLYDKNGKENKDVALFQKSGDLYLAVASGNNIGETAYRIELNEVGEGKDEFVLKEVKVDDELRSELTAVSVNSEGIKLSEAIKEKIVDTFYSEDKAREYRDTMSALKSMSKESRYLSDKSNVLKDINELIKEDAGVKSYIDDNNRFCVADLVNHKVLIFNFDKSTGKPCEEAHLANCDNDGKPIDSTRVKVAQWRENESGSISSLISYDRAYIIDNLMKFEATAKYLTFRGLTAEDKAPTKEKRYSDEAKHSIDTYYKEISELPQFKQMCENGTTIRKTENAIEFIANNKDVTQFSFDSEGNPSEIRHRVAKDGGSAFEKTHKIKGAVINALSNLDLPQDLQQSIVLFTAAQRSINSIISKDEAAIPSPAPEEQVQIAERNYITVEEAANMVFERMPVSFRNELEDKIKNGELTYNEVLDAAEIMPIAYNHIDNSIKSKLTDFVERHPETYNYLMNNGVTIDMVHNNDQSAIDRIYDKARLDMDILSNQSLLSDITDLKREMAEAEALRPKLKENFENSITKITDDVKREASIKERDTVRKETNERE